MVERDYLNITMWQVINIINIQSRLENEISFFKDKIINTTKKKG